MARLSWRKKPRPSGLEGTATIGRYQGLELRLEGAVLAHVDYARDHAAYYWYGGVGDRRHNSLWDKMTYPTPEEAKQAATAYVRKCLAKSEERS